MLFACIFIVLPALKDLYLAARIGKWQWRVSQRESEKFCNKRGWL